jgi:hypothetical protein
LQGREDAGKRAGEVIEDLQRNVSHEVKAKHLYRIDSQRRRSAVQYRPAAR